MSDVISRLLNLKNKSNNNSNTMNEELVNHYNHAEKVFGIGSFTYDAVENSLVASEEAYKIYSRPSFESNIDNFIKLIHPEDQAQMKQAIDSCLKGQA